MARPSRKDVAFIRDAEAELSALRFEARDTWQTFVDALLEHSGAAMTSVHRLALKGEAIDVEFETTAGGPNLREAFRQTVRETNAGGGILYDPARPAPSQRNVVLTPFRDVLGRQPPPASMVRFAAAGGFELSGQVRALVCDGPLLLAWVGGAWDPSETDRATFLLRALMPAIARRLRADRAVRSAPLHAAALEVALDALGVPAFVLVTRGEHDQIELANAAGMRRLDRDGAGLHADLAESRARAPDGGLFRLLPVVAPGLPPTTLAIARTPTGLGARLAAAGTRYGLTPRQLEVLELLVGGHTNRTIGELLRCAEGTVEQHVTALLDKTGSETRSQLVARVWSSPEG